MYMKEPPTNHQVARGLVLYNKNYKLKIQISDVGLIYTLFH